MVEYDLLSQVIYHYGSPHYLFLVLKANNLSLPLNLSGGENIIFPPKALGSKLGEAAARRKRTKLSPV